MIRRLLFGLLAVSLFGLPPVDAGPRKPAKGGLDATLARASSFCERTASRETGPRFELPSGGGIKIHDGRPPALGTPDLVKRFADRQPIIGRIAPSERFYLHFLSPGGDVWAVVYFGLPACSVMVTGAAGDMPAAASRLAETLPKAGWQIAGFTPATAAMPLAKHVLIKKIAKPGTPNFGTMLSLRALAGDSADPTGVQLEMRFLAGELVSSPGATDVEVKMSFPADEVGTSSPDPK